EWPELAEGGRDIAVAAWRKRRTVHRRFLAPSELPATAQLVKSCPFKPRFSCRCFIPVTLCNLRIIRGMNPLIPFRLASTTLSPTTLPPHLKFSCWGLAPFFVRRAEQLTELPGIAGKNGMPCQAPRPHGSFWPERRSGSKA